MICNFPALSERNTVSLFFHPDYLLSYIAHPIPIFIIFLVLTNMLQYADMY